MANASAKRIAVHNENLLKIFNMTALFIYGPIALVYVLFGTRHYFLELFFASPGLLAQYTLNSWCKPKYDTRQQLISSGTNIEDPGLVDYVKDLMYLTWTSALLSSAFGIKAWLLMLIAPAFATYKALNLLKAGKQLFSGSSLQNQEPMPAAETTASTKNKVKKRYV